MSEMSELSQPLQGTPMQQTMMHEQEDPPLENALAAGLGSLYDVLCCLCAGAGCSANMTTVQQGSAGVVTKFGIFDRILPPGRHRYNIFAEKIEQINMMTICLDVPKQEVMSADNLTLKVDAVCYYNVFDATKAAFVVDNFQWCLAKLVQVTIRTVLGEHTLAEILMERQKLNSRMQELLDAGSDAWGIKVTRLEMKQVDIEDRLQRAMAAKAEAIQEAGAKIIQAKAQRDSSKILAEAAKKMESQPTAMKLQWFETLRIISTQGNNTTIIVPDDVEIPTRR